MRESKQRFWDTELGEWATDWMAMNNGRLVADCEGKELVEVTEPERFIPCDFIGIKDKAGADIYDRDIISHEHDGVTVVGEVKFYDGAYFLLAFPENVCIHFYNKVSVIKILGNSLQTPALMCKRK